MEKKIAETVSVRINVGNYQHIEISKYAEKKIEYNNEEEMKKQEDQLTDELIANLVRNMKTIPEKLGKKTDAVVAVEESIIKAIPKWLEEQPEPNIANKAKESNNNVIAEQVTQNKKQEQDLDEEKDLLEADPVIEKDNKKEEVKKVEESDDDLFN